jgi:hypothetical protein
MTTLPFKPFPKLARLSREIIITEKIDGTNAQICITEDGQFLTGSRTRWITPEDDNFGFSKWAHENKDALMLLGPGQHFGEWWGGKIQRGYGVQDKRFSLFNVQRWSTLENNTFGPLSQVCRVVPTLYQGEFSMEAINTSLRVLKLLGSAAEPGFMNPEGIVIYHTAANICFKKTIENDETPKSKVK